MIQEGDQSWPVRNVQLSVDIFEVGLRGVKTDVQLGRDLLIVESLPDPAADFLFLRCQPVLAEDGVERGAKIAQWVQLHEPLVIIAGGNAHLKNIRATAVPECLCFGDPGFGWLVALSDRTRQEPGQRQTEFVSR